jgi:1-acyl-sn-glycerol-3-phosphate acyltransferase
VAVPVSFSTRLGFAWMGLVVAVWTTLCAPVVVLHSAFRPGARTFKRWAGLWARLILITSGVRLRVEDRARLAPGTPAIFVVNHQNALDILTTAAGIPYPFGFAAKASLRKAPLIGWVLARTACLFVDRSTPRKAAESVIVAAERLRNGDPVLLFPEGSRSYSAELGDFQRGAFVLAAQAGAPMVPVVVIDNHRRLDERTYVFRPGRVRLIVGEPIESAGRGKEAVPALMAEVRAWMERELAQNAGAPRPASPAAAI